MVDRTDNTENSVALARRDPKGVSCLALTLFYDYLESRGHTRDALQRDLPYTAEYLDDRTNWIDYETYLVMEGRMPQLIPDDPDLFFNIGCTIASSDRALAFTRVMLSSVISPYRAYAMAPRLVPRFLFPHVSIVFERTGRQDMRGVYSFDAGFEPSIAWIDTARGILASVPTKMGLPPASVCAFRQDAATVVFDVKLQAEWRGPLDFIGRMWRRIHRTGSMRLENVMQSAAELEETNRLLSEKVDALVEAKAELDNRVNDLATMNRVARAAAGEIDLDKLLERMVQTVSSELGDEPTAILLAEGDPPGLAIATSVNLGRAMDRDLRKLSRSKNPVAQTILAGNSVCMISSDYRRWLLEPMHTHDRIVGALVIPLAAEVKVDDSLFPGIASHLAMAIDNARSYRLVEELRDGLELRVLERTVDLEEARAALETTVQQLEQSDQTRRDFFMNVSHEFRTPLTLILAPLEEISQSLQQAGMTESLPSVRHIRSNANALLKLINELLDFAKLDAEQMPMDEKDFNLTTVVGEVIESLQPLADNKSVKMTFNHPELPVGLQADPKLMRRVVLNLVSNAIKYIEAGDEVIISLEHASPRIDLIIQDTGPGIPKAQCDAIFERFKRVNDGRGRRIQGSGIGLAMVKSIVDLHDGHITLESDVGQGAKFTVSLPEPEAELDLEEVHLSVVPAESVVDYADHSHERGEYEIQIPSVIEGGVRAQRSKVLLVEDNPEMRRFVARIIKREHEVIWAANGEEGLNKAMAELPDIVVSDVMMPKIDGFEMCRRLKADPATRNIPVLLVSAMHDTHASVQGLSAGADDFVKKPFSPNELLARINSHLRLRALTRTVMRMEKQTQLGLMAGGIAHEVMNPVHAVLNAAYPLRMVLEKMDAEENDAKIAGSMLDIIESSSHRISKIVKAILQLSRQSEDAAQLEDSVLSEGIDSTVALLEHKTKGVQIHRDYGYEAPFACYPDLLWQVIMNLVSNAADALGDEGGNIWISTTRERDNVVIRVRDDGPGIPVDKRDKIFAPFFTTKDPGKGTGLGLAISMEITELHGGTLTLSPPSVSGTEFVLTLPIVCQDRPVAVNG